METIAPFAKVFEWGDGATSIMAVILGIGFGFALEQGGLGNPRVLAGQWFGYDFAVLRVMFTAILVAMLGLFGLHYLGLLNMELVYINGTFIWPQLVGGIIFGFGFVIGQHCPGTAVVACGTGNYDAVSYIGGFMVGAIGFSLAFPLFENFYLSSSYGRFLLPEAAGVPPGVIVFAVVVVALGAFAFTHYLDRRLGNVPAEGES